MAFELGQSFSPTDQSLQQQAQNGSLTPVQQAIKILSLRVPPQPGGSSIAPNALLTAPGGLGGSPDLLAILKKLLMGGSAGPGGPGIPGSVPGAPPPSTAIVPNIVPGGTGAPQPGPGLPTAPGAPPSMAPLPGPGTPTQGALPPPGGSVIDRTNPLPSVLGSPTFHAGMTRAF